MLNLSSGSGVGEEEGEEGEEGELRYLKLPCVIRFLNVREKKSVQVVMAARRMAG
jgi:hypothetical protein